MLTRGHETGLWLSQSDLMCQGENGKGIHATALLIVAGGFGGDKSEGGGVIGVDKRQSPHLQMQESEG